ncbi:Fe-S oxidoreductase [Clostridium punense]|uniref:Fe-S oxidoreductase n=1 Tax=Clostridium punense TaxID=1054297 RepID=A0ABS4K9A1_9CLOT|nr:(Fe-S)-binding protein [Clostridium punense]MBP2024372.1 Fe-S oxidoreductase [Clostridium punense]
MEDKYIVKKENTLSKINSIKDGCIQCGKCVKSCLMLQEYCNKPKEFFTNVCESKNIETIIPFSCSLCGKCNLVCPKNLDIQDAFMGLREDIVEQNNGISPLKGHETIHMHQKFSFSPLFTGIVKESDKVERLFMPGCSLSAYNYELVLKVYEYIKDKIPGTGLLLGCCGRPTKDLGESDEFKKKYSNLDNMIKNSGAKEIITACQSCLKVVGEESPEYVVKSLWTVLRDLGVPEGAKGIGSESDLEFSIKDSCASMRNIELQDSIRSIMDELGYKVKEQKEKNVSCCGTGGMIHTVNTDLSKKIMLDSAMKCDTDYIVTYCGGCRNSMVQGGKHSLHILDLVFKDIWTSKSSMPTAVGSLKSWMNRFQVKRKSKTIK